MAGPSREPIYLTLAIGVMMAALCGTCTWNVVSAGPDPHGFYDLSALVGCGGFVIGVLMVVGAILRLRRNR
jgi:hypothetical protein